jgi:hypothetical protein
LQPRAPHDYEIRDEWDRLVPLSLVGYILKPGTKYKLIVTSANENGSSFDLDFHTPKRIAESLDDEATAQDKSRYLTFEVNSNPTGLGLIHPILQLTELSTLSVRVTYGDTREPFELEIPIVVTRNVWLGILSLISPTIIGVVLEVVRNQTIPDWWDFVKLGVLGIIIWLILFAVDNFRIWRMARKAKVILDRALPELQKSTEIAPESGAVTA